MVKIGFICEGESEKIILESELFQTFLKKLNLLCVFPVIDAGGNGNLLPKNIEIFLQVLKKAGADSVFILTDLDQDKCISLTKERINSNPILNIETFTIIAVKQIESWFLADSDLMSRLLNVTYFEEFPESHNVPVEELSLLCQRFTKRGLGSNKPKIVKKMIGLGFDIERAALHPQCRSAHYFTDKIKKVAGIHK